MARAKEPAGQQSVTSEGGWSAGCTAGLDPAHVAELGASKAPTPTKRIMSPAQINPVRAAEVVISAPGLADDNGGSARGCQELRASSHRGAASITRMGRAWPNAHLIRLPAHAFCLDQAEIYFSIVQRKVI